jgi:hypothetical protein
MPFFFIILTLVFREVSYWPHVAIFEEEACVIRGGIQMMRLVVKNHELLTNFTALVQQQTQQKSVFTRKVTYQWALQ